MIASASSESDPAALRNSTTHLLLKVIGLQEAPTTTGKSELVEQAEALLALWPVRQSMLPKTKPLNEAWLPKTSPFAKQSENVQSRASQRSSDMSSTPWWRWSPSDPTRLYDAATNQPLPDTFPYANFAAIECCRATMQKYEDFHTLAKAWKQTKDARFSRAIVDMLVAYSPLYAQYPLTVVAQGNPDKLITHGFETCGTTYTVRAHHGWIDTRDLQQWLEAYRQVRDCPAINKQDDDAIRALATTVLESNALPNFLYINDKYHNSLTNYYEAFILVATLWGQAIEVRNVVTGDVYRGGDLAQMAVNGPAGLRMFVANAFDREGTYWEMSSSYTGYIQNFLKKILPLLEQYSDPAGYEPHANVRPFYEPIDSFDVARELPTFWRTILAAIRLAFTGGQLPPTNDSNYLNRIKPDDLVFWAKLLANDTLEQYAAEAKRIDAGEKSDRLLAGSALMACTGAATLRGPAGRLNVHMDWHMVQDYHSHLDPLNIVISAHGQTMLSDLGYHLSHPLRHTLSERTAAHNTVTVDQHDANRHGVGKLHHVLLDTPAQWIDASVDDAYGVCDVYRRSIILVGDRYTLDIFRVQGGEQHDYALLGRADKTTTASPVGQTSQGTLQNPDEPYAGFGHLDISASTPASPYQVLHHVTPIHVEQQLTIDWVHRDQPELTTRIHHLSVDDASELLTMKVPYRERLANNEIRHDQMLMHRRKGAPGLASTFVSLIEALGPGVTNIKSCQRLAIESQDPHAVAVRVEHEQGHDVVIQANTPGPHVVPNEAITLKGFFACVMTDVKSKTRKVTLLGESLTLAGELIQGSDVESARVTSVDVKTGELTLDKSLASSRKLDGLFVKIRNANGSDSHWRIRNVNDDGRSVLLDQDYSEIITMQGRVERVDNARSFATGVRWPAPPALDDWVRIGPLGDFDSERYRLRFAQQTGLPLRIGGTTTTESVREYRIGLTPDAALTSADVGRPFWISGIEPGDDMFAQMPVVQKINL